MQRFFKLGEGIGVEKVLAQVLAHEELWDQHRERTEHEGSPFARTSDMWLRWNDPARRGEPTFHSEPHFASWYPAWDVLTELHPIVFAAMYSVRAVHLGAVLLMRIPPGESIDQHNDKGSWHPEFMDAKVFVTLAGEGVWQSGEKFQTFRPGDAWTFNNLILHGIRNSGSVPHIVAIINMRSATGNFCNMKEQ